MYVVSKAHIQPGLYMCMYLEDFKKRFMEKENRTKMINEGK